MWHRVAALLGRTVAELQAVMSSAEFVDWCGYYQLEPWGYEMANWRMGVLATTVANFSGNAKKATKPADFMPKPIAPPRPTRMSSREIKAAMHQVLRKGEPTDGE